MLADLLGEQVPAANKQEILKSRMQKVITKSIAEELGIKSRKEEHIATGPKMPI